MITKQTLLSLICGIGLGWLAGFILLAIGMFGSQILFLVSFDLCCADKNVVRQSYPYPYWGFIVMLYAVYFDLLFTQDYDDPNFVMVTFFLVAFGAILGLIMQGLKKLFRFFAAKRSSPTLEGG